MTLQSTPSLRPPSTHTNSMQALLLLMHAGQTAVWTQDKNTPRRLEARDAERIPQRVAYSGESLYYDVQLGAARALQTI